MLVHFNPGNDVEGRESLAARAEQIVSDVIGRFSGQITRIEVYVSDDNGGKKGADRTHHKAHARASGRPVGADVIRCTLEARITGHQPVAVTNHAPTFGEAISGAAEKLERSLDHTLGRLNRA